jgi:hypothetical protein
MSVSINGDNGLTFNDGSTQTTSPFTGGFGFRNRIINGAMVIDQRNATVTSTAAGAYITDRWNTFADQAYSIARDSDAPSGYAYSLKVTKTSSNQSSYAFLVQYIEGLNCIDLAFGTASAATVTISFWVRSSITGNFAVSLTNSAENRTYAALYAINSANTWEQKSVTIPGDTSGTWLKTNGKGISLQFNYGQAAGAGAVNSWVSATNIAPSGCTNLGTTNGATFYITGVQLEKGSTATSFDYRPYGTELALCQRYYEKSFVIDTAPANGVYSMGYIGYVCFADQWVFAAPTILFKVTKRATPTIAFFGTSTNTWQINDNSNNWINYAAVSTGFQASIGIFTTGFSAGVHNNGNSGYAIGSARMIRGDWTASSEL